MVNRDKEMENQAKTSVIIATKNDIMHIEKCLSSLMPYYKAGYIKEIIIIDGHSTDGTLDILEKYPVKVMFENGKTNICIAYDLVWRETRGEFVLMINSDVYLGDEFFPTIFDLMTGRVGWISCLEKAVVNDNWLSRAQAESWSASTFMLATSSSLIRRIYSRFTSGGSKPLCGGPCMLIRRSCLEEINGLLGLRLHTIGVCGDVSYSQRIAQRGWDTIWWPEAPVYHHPKLSFKGVVRQFQDYSRSLAYMHLEKEFKDYYKWHGKIMGIFARLSSPLISVYLAIRFRNPAHLIVYPIPRYAAAISYIEGWIQAKRPTQAIYTEPGVFPVTLKRSS